MQYLVHFLDLSFEIELVLLKFRLERNRMVHVLFCQPLVLLVLAILLLALSFNPVSLRLELGALSLHIG